MPKKPYIIGITGNIASGKSVVSQYLQNLGALSIDADVLGQRVLSKMGPGYNSVIEAFGPSLLNQDGEIDRKLLANIVFSDPQKLSLLESISHPYVINAIKNIIFQTKASVVVIEAIKLIEEGAGKLCQNIWSVVAQDEIRLQRLIQNRHLSPEIAQLRISSQAPQEEKIRSSDIVIQTDGSFQDTYQQIIESVFGNSQLFKGNEIWFALSNSQILRKLTLSEIPILSDFFNSFGRVAINQGQMIKNFGMFSYWGVIEEGKLVAVLIGKQKIGIAAIIEIHVLDGYQSLMNPIFPEIIFNLKQYLKNDFVEDFILPVETQTKGSKPPSPKITKIRDLEYAYRSVLLQFVGLDVEMKLFTLDTPAEFNKLFFC